LSVLSPAAFNAAPASANGALAGAAEPTLEKPPIVNAVAAASNIFDFIMIVTPRVRF
jgi:hypothetical protein